MLGLMVHGRFQPFHNEHLAYLAEALDRTAGALIVGITNPDPRGAPEIASATDDHRHRGDANPWSFTERAAMVQASLHLEGLWSPRVTVIPFPLDDIRSAAFLARYVAQFVNVFEPWEEEKCRRFAQAGFEVVRYTRARSISGSQVRALLAGGQSVNHLIPAGTASVLGLDSR